MSAAPPGLVADRREQRRAGSAPPPLGHHAERQDLALAVEVESQGKAGRHIVLPGDPPEEPGDRDDLRHRLRGPTAPPGSRRGAASTAARRARRRPRRKPAARRRLTIRVSQSAARNSGWGKPCGGRGHVGRAQVERLHRDFARVRRHASAASPRAGHRGRGPPGPRRGSCRRERRAPLQRAPRRRRQRRASARRPPARNPGERLGQHRRRRAERPTRGIEDLHVQIGAAAFERDEKIAITAGSRGRSAATASKPVTPISGRSRPRAIPCAAASPTRMPVKLPGPMVTAMRSSAAAGSPASAQRAVDHRQQRLGLAVRNRPVLGAEHPIAGGHRHRTGRSGRVERQDQRIVGAPMQMRRIQTARTSTTSGM